MIRLPAPVRPAQPPEAIAATHARITATARVHLPFGVLTDTDRQGLVRRTAQLCGVPVETVREVCGG